jgi:hypothetical protein
MRLAGTQVPVAPFLINTSGPILPFVASCFKSSDEIGPRSAFPTRTYHSIAMIPPSSQP